MAVNVCVVVGIMSLENQILCGDCLEVLKNIADESVSMILTDPPYGISYKSNMSPNHKRIKNDDFTSWFRLLPLWLAEFRRVLQSDGVIVMFAGGGGRTPVQALATQIFVEHFSLITTAIWDRKRPGLGWRYRSQYETILIGSKAARYRFYDKSNRLTNVFQYLNLIPRKGEHPTPKPVALLERFLEIHTLPNDLVLDPFAGGGSTIEACIRTGRRYLGIELDEQYCDLARRRAWRASLN